MCLWLSFRGLCCAQKHCTPSKYRQLCVLLKSLEYTIITPGLLIFREVLQDFII